MSTTRGRAPVAETAYARSRRVLERLARTLIEESLVNDAGARNEVLDAFIDASGWSAETATVAFEAEIVRLTEDARQQEESLSQLGPKRTAVGRPILVVSAHEPQLPTPRSVEQDEATTSRPHPCRLCKTNRHWRLASERWSPWVCERCHPCPHPHDHVEWSEEVAS